MALLRLTLFLPGRLVRFRRVRRALGLTAVHLGIACRDWSLLWCAEKGKVEIGSGSGVAEVRRDLSEGESAVVWGERYEARDLVDFELEISESTTEELRRAAESEALLWRAGLCAGEDEASLRSLAGAASACCAGRVLRCLGLWDRERDAEALTCADWLELACSRGICSRRTRY
jgi:hypothetical protein